MRARRVMASRWARRWYCCDEDCLAHRRCTYARAGAGPAFAATQGRSVPERIPRERRLLRPDQRASAGRRAQARAVPGKLDTVEQLLHRDAAALTLRRLG